MNLKTKEDIVDILKKIEESDKIAKSEIPPVEFKDVVTYQRIRVMAQEEMQRAKLFYKEYIENHIGGIILKGPMEKQKEFAKLSYEIGKTIEFDSQELYRKLTDVGFVMMGGKQTLNADQLALVYTETRLLARGELGLFRMQDPDISWMFTRAWDDPQTFSDGFRNSLFRTNGIKLTQAALLKKVYEESLANPIPRTTIPVVLEGIKDEELEEFRAFLKHGYIEVNLEDKEVDKKLVTDSFNQLKTVIKNNQNKETT